MSTHIKETLFAGRDNVFVAKYTVDGDPQDFSVATKIEFTLNNKTVDSVTNPTYFTADAGGEIEFSLGDASYTSSDTGYATVVAYDVSNPDGVVFSSPKGPTKLHITVS